MIISINSTDEEATNTLWNWKEDRNISKSHKERDVLEEDLEEWIEAHQVELELGDNIPDEGDSNCRGMLREKQVLLKA